MAKVARANGHQIMILSRIRRSVPFGLFRPDTNETWLFFTSGSVTSDFMIDRLEDIWPDLKKR